MDLNEIRALEANGIRVVVDHIVRETKGCKTFGQKSKTTHHFIRGGNKPQGYAKMFAF